MDFLSSAPERFERLVLVGDIFDLWIARPHLHEEHHERVLRAVASARSAGLPVDYAVGNRDYAVETLHPPPFDRVAVETLPAPDGAPWIAEHGDLVNDDDAPYRRWRAFSRSAAVLGAFLALPGPVGRPLSAWLERRMRTTNLEYKRRFPEEHVRRRAERHFSSDTAAGARYLVLGHFHQEIRQVIPPTPSAPSGGEVLVLPCWKTHRRHLEWDPISEAMTFVPSLPF